MFDSNLTPVKLFGMIDAASVETENKDYSFSLSLFEKGYVLRPGDGVGILYGGGDSDNRLTVRIDGAGLFDGRKTFHRSFEQDENRWVSQTDTDMEMKLTSKNAPVTQPAKYVMIHFDDGFQSQYDHAYPVLEQHGLKGTFWIVCDYANSTRDGYMNWKQVDQLASDGQDIQNHGMTHAHLPTLTDGQIAAQIRDCKEMIVQHGSTGDAFAIPFNDGNEDPEIIGIISKIHAYGKGSGGAPQAADCGGSCETTNADGTYNKDNRYTMKQWSHDAFIRNGNMTGRQLLDGFVETVNSGEVDADGGIVKIPIIMYHRINEGGTSSPASLFAAEMQYLRDNGFRTIGMDDIMYDQQEKKFRLR
ncbi:polysaccharide deacetylase family protein [Candidatus Nitrososphaera sp. FF02]|uniref:polysaccharide deacetylase family protein n=1 Tax=Candidatus Nitrososphaera sp. FF02 TaxID=3398226 RepID=UPI0039EC4FE4